MGDACLLPYENGTFDVVYSFQMIVHSPSEQRAQALYNVLRVMAPEGHAILDMLDNIDYSDRWLHEFRNPNPFGNVVMGDPFFGYVPSWQYTDNDGRHFNFSPINERPQASPGIIVMSGSMSTPFVHVKQLKKSE